MRRIALVILAASLAGCAAQHRAAPVSHAAATHPAVNLAALSLDQILPAPHLRTTTSAATEPSQAPVDALVMFAKAREAMLDGQRHQAINLLEQAIRLDPQSFTLRFYLGEASSGSGMSLQPAIDAYEAAATIDPDHGDLQMRLGRLYLAKGDVAQSIRHLRLGLQTADYRDNDSIAAVTDFYLGKALAQAGYDQAALESYESLIARLSSGDLDTRQSPDLAYLIAEPDALFDDIGTLSEKRGMTGQAVRFFAMASQSKPDEFIYAAHLVVALAADGQMQQAANRAVDAVRDFHASPESLALLKRVFRGSGGDAAVERELHQLHADNPQDRTILYALVDILAQSGKIPEARKYLLQAARESNYETQTVRRLFKLEDSSDDVDGAAKVLIEALAARPDALRDLSPLWTSLIQPWRKDRLTISRMQGIPVSADQEAAKAFWISRLAEVWGRDGLERSALKSSVNEIPAFAPAYRTLLSQDWARDDWNDAQKKSASADLAERAAKGGDRSLSLELQGLALLQGKKPSKAVMKFSKARDAGGNSSDLRLEYSAALGASGDSDRARQLLISLIEDQPTCEEAYLALFRSYLEDHKADQAVKVLNAWLGNDPESVNARLLQSSVLLQAGENAQAEQVLNNLWDRDPDNADVLGAMSAFYAQAGRLAEWTKKLEVLHGAHPEYRAAIEQLVMLYVQQKEMPEALRVLASVRQSVHDDPDLLYQTASLYSRIGQKALAEQTLEEVIRIDPDHAAACNDLGFSWADAGTHLARAESLLRTAVAKEPDNQSFLDSLGWVLYKRGQFEESKKYLQAAISESSRPDPVVLDHLGDALDRLNEHAQAASEWKRARDRLGEADPADRDDIKALRVHLDAKIKEQAAGQKADTAAVGEEMRK